jgi:hypothetical protein
MAVINEQRNITITDLIGHTVLTSTVAPNTTKTELNYSLSPGIYILNIQGASTAEMHKLVIE